MAQVRVTTVSERLKKMDRIWKVHKQLHKMAEWELVRLQRKGAELEVAQAELIEALNNDKQLYGLFVDAAAKRLQSLAGQAKQVHVERLNQADVTLEKALQAKRTEKVVASLKDASRKESEKKDLLSALEAISTRGDASPA
jgi:HPt (histidine-containing phosphotransfer) domain-containing protein